MPSIVLRAGSALPLIVSLACTADPERPVPPANASSAASADASSSEGSASASSCRSTGPCEYAPTSGTSSAHTDISASSVTSGTTSGKVSLSTADAGVEAGTEPTDSGESAPPSDAGAPILFPPDLPMVRLGGDQEGVNLVAATMVDGPNGPELFAAMTNTSAIAACDPAISVEIFDKDGQSLAATVGAIFGKMFRRAEGTGGAIVCVEPGDTVMTAIQDLPDIVTVAELGQVLYQFVYFNRDIIPFELVPLEGLDAPPVSPVTTSAGTAFTGIYTNGLEVPISRATVTVFPVTDEGRPLGVATVTATADLPPMATWTFETAPVVDPGQGTVVFATGSMSFD